MENWKTHRVDDLTRQNILVVGDGYRAKNSELSFSGLPFARGANINQGFHLEGAECLDAANLHRAGEKISRPGDVVFTSKGSVGRFAFVNGNTPRFVYSPQLCYWRVLNTAFIDPKFLYFWMHGQEFLEQANGVKGQTDMADYVSLVNQRRFYITLPPIEEQKAIAKILSSLDDKIELNRRMNATLEAMAQALFKAWFVDFEPVHANRENRWSKSASPKITKLFPSDFENEIPKGWCRGRINELAKEIQYGFTQSSTKEEVGPKFLRITDIQGGMINWSKVPFCEIGNRELRKYIVQEHDIFIARTGASTGENAYVIDPPVAVFASYLIRVQFADPAISFYIGKYLRSTEYNDYVASILGGSAQPNANAQKLTGVEVVVPRASILKAYFDLCCPLERKKRSNENENMTIARTRDELLPKLIVGKLSSYGLH
jgi:type I restriction enzyme, S subunit